MDGWLGGWVDGWMGGCGSRSSWRTWERRMDEREGGGGMEHGGGEIERARDGVRLIVLAMLGKKKTALVEAVCEVIVGSGSAEESGKGTGGGGSGGGAGASLRETARRHGVHEQTLASAVRAARRRIREVIGDGRGEGRCEGGGEVEGHGEGEGEGVKGGGA